MKTIILIYWDLALEVKRNQNKEKPETGNAVFSDELGKHEEKLTKYMGYKCRIPFRST
jgi:tetrahydromethanopterin S-methyltransferase subunit H